MKFTFTHMTGSKAGQTEVFEAAQITVGRGEGNLLRFDPHLDDKVSTFHARIDDQGGQAVLTDLDSSNGTLVNGQRVRGSVPLISGAVLTFGAEGGPNVAIQFAGAAAPTPAGPGATARPGATPSGPPPALARTAPVPIAGGGGAPAKPQGGGGGAGKKLLAGGILGTVVMFFVGCLLFTVVVAANKQVRAALPPWAVNLVRKIPGVNKLMKTPQAPRLPGGIRTPRPRLPSGGGSSGDADEAPPDDEAPSEEAPPGDEGGE